MLWIITDSILKLNTHSSVARFGTYWTSIYSSPKWKLKSSGGQTTWRGLTACCVARLNFKLVIFFSHQFKCRQVLPLAVQPFYHLDSSSEDTASKSSILHEFLSLMHWGKSNSSWNLGAVKRKDLQLIYNILFPVLNRYETNIWYSRRCSVVAWKPNKF